MLELRLTRPEELGAEAAGEGVRVPAPLEAPRLHGRVFLGGHLKVSLEGLLQIVRGETLPECVPD